MVEFSIVAIPIIFLTTSIIEMGLESWKFHSMVYAIDQAARYASAHGRTCTKNGNTCTIQVKDVANYITNTAPALDTSRLNVTLTTHSTSVSCTPLYNCTTQHCPTNTTCTNNTAQFPSSNDNGVGLDITIQATYAMYNPIPMLWFGSSPSRGQDFTLGARTRQTIVY